MEQNPELALAWRFVVETGTNLFLTGKAGTGKTTFLRRLKSENPKRMIVLAPTGIAAINAEGVTIHSFFQLPFAPYVPDSSFMADGKASYRFRFGKEKINIIRSIDLLVIDEISMVRADLLDAVDGVLRRYRDRNRPFGGVQLLLIGDLRQLAPVVRDADWLLLEKYYDTPYFFSSHALKQTDYCVIELNTVYRQKEGPFLDLLNRIRDNSCDRQVLEALNRRYLPDFHPRKEEGYIRLVTHNYQAQRINDRELQALPGRTYPFRAAIEGKFPDFAYPTDEVLELKVGAQVMFVKNDTSGEHRFYNGMIGEVTAVSRTGIEVRGKGADVSFALQKEVWNNAKYALNDETKEITEEIEGTFRQYPVKLAWAITIHKSQGLTFERAIIDVSASFAHGQVYVALSRCKALEGLVLARPFSARAIISDEAVDAFTAQARQNIPGAERVNKLQQAYFYDLLAGLFDFLPLEQALRKYVRLIDEFLYRLYPQQLAAYKAEAGRFHEKVTEVARRFNVQYTRLVNTATDYATDEVLQQRIHLGAAYFMEQISPLEHLLSATMLGTDNKELKKKLLDAQEELSAGLERKKALLSFVAKEGFHTTSFLRQKALSAIEGTSPKTKKGKVAAASPDTAGTDILHPELYRQLIEWRNEQAGQAHVPLYKVIRQKAVLGICNLLPLDKAALARVPYFGRKGVEKYGDSILNIVHSYLKNCGDTAAEG